jgi:hypothetical protein
MGTQLILQRVDCRLISRATFSRPPRSRWQERQSCHFLAANASHLGMPGGAAGANLPFTPRYLSYRFPCRAFLTSLFYSLCLKQAQNVCARAMNGVRQHTFPALMQHARAYGLACLTHLLPLYHIMVFRQRPSSKIVRMHSSVPAEPLP